MKCKYGEESKLYIATVILNFAFCSFFFPQVGDRDLLLPKTTAITRFWEPGSCCFRIPALQALSAADLMKCRVCRQAGERLLRPSTGVGGSGVEEDPLVLPHSSLWATQDCTGDGFCSRVRKRCLSRKELCKERRRSSSWSKIHQDWKKKPVTTEQNSTIKGMWGQKTGEGQCKFNVACPIRAVLWVRWAWWGFPFAGKKEQISVLWERWRTGNGRLSTEGWWVGQKNQGRSVMVFEWSGGRRGSHHQAGNCV